jgi:hypothetical protein
VVFYVCEAEYRGQIYGSETCQRDARRSANARHQASPEGDSITATRCGTIEHDGGVHAGR